MITGKLYDQLKFLAQILLPALGTLYFALAGLWNLPSAQEVVGTVLAVDTFLGVLLGISSTQYNKDVVAAGTMNVVSSDEGLKYTLELDQDPEVLGRKKEIHLKVNRSRQAKSGRK